MNLLNVFGDNTNFYKNNIYILHLEYNVLYILTVSLKNLFLMF